MTDAVDSPHDVAEGTELPRIVVRATDGSGSPLADPVAVCIPVGKPVRLGRESDLAVGVDPYDGGISRIALTVEARADGWRLEIGNRNGAVVHPWAQQPVWVSGGESYTLAWPRVGVRLTGADPDAVLHWVLLEYDGFGQASVGRPELDTSATVYADRPDALTTPQLTAVTALFGEHLLWPPKLGPAPESLKRVARRLAVSQAAVIQRLQGAQQRAYQLGSHSQVGVTEPDYFYVLARHGYLPWPVERCPATEIDMSLDLDA